MLLLYEKTSVYYIQKLLLCERFKIPLDHKITDISLDKTCFLLDQEMKSCRDQNINPLSGGKISLMHFVFVLKLLNPVMKILKNLIKRMDNIIYY